MKPSGKEKTAMQLTGAQILMKIMQEEGVNTIF